jgi:hypothetical protein
MATPIATSAAADPMLSTATGFPSPFPTYTSGSGDDYGNCPKTHSLATAAGVGIGVGVFVATIIILAFIFIHRRQSRARKVLPTISPNVLVTGPMTEDKHEWEEYHEQPKGLGRGGGSVKHKDPPTYTKST